MAAILVACIGNIFLGDDGFGVAMAQKLAARSWPPGVRVIDFGIRGMDLVYALLEDYDAFVFVDATPQGGAPGTLYLIEHVADARDAASFEAHGMHPAQALAMAQSMGGRPTRTYVIGCEPAPLPVSGTDYDEVAMELSAPVQGALAEAETMVIELIAKLLAEADAQTCAEPTAEAA